MTLYVSAHRTQISLELLSDGCTVQFNVIAEGEGPAILLLSGNAHIRDCDLSLSRMDGLPMLGMGLNVLQLADIATMQAISSHLGLPMPTIHPGFCAPQQGMLA